MWRADLRAVDPDGGLPVTAPKLSCTRRPFQFDGTVKVRLYQSLSFSVILRWMPESADSATNGTLICSANAAGCPASGR